MRSSRPGSVSAAAIMAIIYGSLFGLCGMCGTAGLITQGAVGQNFMGGGKAGDPVVDALKKELEAIPGHQAVEVVQNVGGLLISIAMLIGGIGMLNLRRSARNLTVAAAIIAIALTAFQTFYQVVFYLPALNKAFQEALPAAIQQQGQKGPPPQDLKKVMEVMEFGMTAAGVVFAIMYGLVVVYLIVILILLAGRHARAAFAAGPALTGQHDERFERARDEDRRPDYPDEDWPPPSDEPRDERFRPK